jgi:hypothetical protein
MVWTDIIKAIFSILVEPLLGLAAVYATLYLKNKIAQLKINTSQ